MSRQQSGEGAAGAPPRVARLAFARTLALLWAVGFAVRILPFRTLASVLLGPRSRRRGTWSPEDSVALVARASACCRPAPTCLARALVLARLLARHGLDADVVLGVASEHGRFAAHAWVEHDGRPLDPDACGAACYAELCRLDGRGVAAELKSC